MYFENPDAVQWFLVCHQNKFPHQEKVTLVFQFVHPKMNRKDTWDGHKEHVINIPSFPLYLWWNVFAFVLDFQLIFFSGQTTQKTTPHFHAAGSLRCLLPLPFAQAATHCSPRTDAQPPSVPSDFLVVLKHTQKVSVDHHKELRSFRSQSYLKPDWTWPWATCSRWNFSEQGVGTA